MGIAVTRKQGHFLDLVPRAMLPRRSRPALPGGKMQPTCSCDFGSTASSVAAASFCMGRALDETTGLCDLPVFILECFVLLHAMLL